MVELLKLTKLNRVPSLIEVYYSILFIYFFLEGASSARSFFNFFLAKSHFYLGYINKYNK